MTIRYSYEKSLRTPVVVIDFIECLLCCLCQISMNAARSVSASTHARTRGVHISVRATMDMNWHPIHAAAMVSEEELV